MTYCTEKSGFCFLFGDFFLQQIESVKSRMTEVAANGLRFQHTSENIPGPGKPSARRMHLPKTKEMFYNMSDHDLFASPYST